MHLARQVIEGRTDLTAEEIVQLVEQLREMYQGLPNVVETPRRNTYYIGDLHGDLQSLEAVRNLFLGGKDQSLVFLGDYADRGSHQVETVNLVMALAVEYPKQVIMLRGNHESNRVARTYGFYNAVKGRYSPKLFDAYCSAFEVLPLAGLSPNGIFSCHGGVPEGVDSLRTIQSVDRFKPDLMDPVAFQLTWNDPAEGNFRFGPSMRGGGSRIFGRYAFDEFVESLGVNRMIRAHQAFPEGVQTFFEKRLFSVFSTANCGRVNPKILHIKNDLVPQPIQI